MPARLTQNQDMPAVSGALRAQLARRGERIDQIVVSAPVSGRAEASPAQPGNQVGVTPVMIPASGAPLGRLAAIAEITRRHKSRTKGSISRMVLSYAGTLTVTVIVDGGACPDSGALVAALQGELDALTAPIKT